MKILNLTVSAVMALTLSACASLSKEGQQVRVTDGAGVQDCKFLKQVSSASGWGATGGVDIAKIGVLNEAGKIGATHVVFTSMNPIFIATVSGDAYKCSAKKI